MSNKTKFLTFIKSKVAELETVAYYFAIFQVRLFAYQKACISVENILKAVYFAQQSGLLETPNIFFSSSIHRKKNWSLWRIQTNFNHSNLFF